MLKKNKPNEEKHGRAGSISRRKFLAGAGLVFGGAIVGAEIANALIHSKEGIKEIEVPIEVSKYVCPYCSSEFAAFGTLTDHIKDEHAGSEIIDQFVCPYCSQKFISIEALRAHLGAENLINLVVNGRPYELKVESSWTLAFVIREKLGLMGTKIGCDRGSCGTCAVIVDGKSVYSCMILAAEADGGDIMTIEGLSDGLTLHPIQQAFIDNDASQCGYCIPGFIISAKALLDANPNPTRDEIREALSGHICNCGHTKKIVDAVLSCAQKD